MPQRFSAAREVAAVARLLREESLEVVARELNVTVARLSESRERALAAAASAMMERERNERDAKIARLKAKLDEITMDNELLREKISALEEGIATFVRRTTLRSNAPGTAMDDCPA